MLLIPIIHYGLDNLICLSTYGHFLHMLYYNVTLDITQVRPFFERVKQCFSNIEILRLISAVPSDETRDVGPRAYNDS